MSPLPIGILAVSGAGKVQLIGIATNTSPYMAIYPWKPGFGAKYADPVSAPSFNGSRISWNPNGESFVVACASGFYGEVAAYAWADGIGTRFAGPAGGPAYGNGSFQGMDFSTSGNDIGFGSSTSPFFYIYPYSNGFGTKYAGVSGPGNSGSVAFGEDIVFFSSTSGNGVYGYKFTSGVGIVTGFTNPYIYTPVSDINLSTNANVLGISRSGNPRGYQYQVSNTGWGTSYTNPVGTDQYGNAFNATDDLYAIGHAISPFLSVFPWSYASGAGTKLANPSTLPASAGTKVNFTKLGNDIAVTHGTAPYISAYPVSASGFGVKYANPVGLPGAANDLEFA